MFFDTGKSSRKHGQKAIYGEKKLEEKDEN